MKKLLLALSVVGTLSLGACSDPSEDHAKQAAQEHENNAAEPNEEGYNSVEENPRVDSTQDMGSGVQEKE